MPIRLYEKDPAKYRVIQTALLRLGIPTEPWEGDGAEHAPCHVLVGSVEWLKEAKARRGASLLFCLAGESREAEGVRLVSSVGEFAQMHAEGTVHTERMKLTKCERRIVRCLAERGHAGVTGQTLTELCLLPRGGHLPCSIVTHIAHINRKAICALGCRMIEYREGRYRLCQGGA